MSPRPTKGVGLPTACDKIIKLDDIVNNFLDSPHQMCVAVTQDIMYRFVRE
jgi:hypothetical protein